MTAQVEKIELIETTDELAAFESGLNQDNLMGVWKVDPMLNSIIGGPTPIGVGHVWPGDVSRRRLEEAAQLLGPAGSGRTNVSFVNPGIDRLPKGTTTTLTAGFQVVKAHDICDSHRHSMAAVRFVVQGSPEAYTAVDGEVLNMEQYDLLVTPRFSWHDHHNPSDTDVIWMDVLDVGLTMMLNAGFYETYGKVSQDMRTDPAEAQELRAANVLRPVWEQTRQNRFPIRYRWADVVKVLDAYGDTVGSPYEGVALEYVNPVTNGPTLPTIDCWVQQLVPGFDGRPHRRTSNTVGYVISGYGTLEVEGTKLSFGPGDSYAVPGYAWHALRNESDEPLRLFSSNDSPAMAAVGLYYEEPEPMLHATPAPKVPAQPTNPLYRTTALLEPDEVR